MRIALVNTNRMKPPIAPLGLEYVAEALAAAGFEVALLDLCWADEWEPALANFFDRRSFDLIGVTLRNTDDCAFSTRQSFLGEFAAMVAAVRARAAAPVVIGGVGFSVLPETVMKFSGADVGVWGDGEFTFLEAARRLERGEPWDDLPNLIRRDRGKWRRNPPFPFSLEDLPPLRRNRFDNRRYFREGGQAGFESKRGCPGRCVYCADPVAKGRSVRTRPPSAVVDELESLLGQGIDHLHTCDSEFNLPAEHAGAVCREIVRRQLGDKLRWYAYCSPAPFSAELAGLMKRSGCAGINFGADSGDDRMLGSLGRGFTSEDVLQAVRVCKEAGITVMLDLLIGAPGETETSIVNTVALAERSGADRCGIALGVRIYPGTELARRLEETGPSRGLVGGEAPSSPLFFLEPAIAGTASALLDRLIGNDRRFFFFDPARPERNYNYNANRLLSEAIERGYRGAYWDILRRAAA